MKFLTKKNMTILGIVCVIAALYGIIKSGSSSSGNEDQFDPVDGSYSLSADGSSLTQQDDASSLTSNSYERNASSQDDALVRASNNEQQNVAKETDIALDEDANDISDETLNKTSNKTTILDETSDDAPSEVELALAQTAVRTANLLNQEGNFAHNASEQAYNELRGAAVGLANNELSSFLNRYGTARVQLNVDNKFRLADSAIDMLFPLFETKSSLTFTQLGLRYNNQDERTIGNFGLGQRYFIDDFMLGYNGFFDYDFSRHHSRLGLGLEFAKDYLRLTSNGYIGLSDWKDSKDFNNYEERAASGIDALLEAYYPSYPQLGLNLKVEAYWGDEVALVSKDKLERNPVAFTGGLTYTPIPLVTMGASYMHTNNNNHEAKFNVDVNYAFGVPLGQQLDGSNVDSLRSLMGSRYALVERNNNIVLEYKKKTGIELTLPAKVSGYTGEMKLVTAKVKAANGLDHLEWDGSAITAIGGEVIAKDALSSQIKLPAYQYGDNANNSHKVTAIAYDRQGNTSSRESVEVEVFETKVSAAHSKFEASPSKIVADGQDASTLTLTLKDKNGAAILGAEKGLTFKVEGVDNTAFSEVRPLADGRYEVDFSGRSAGLAHITPVLNASALEGLKGEITLTAVVLDADEAHSSFKIEPNKIIANVVSEAVLSFTAKDTNGNPVEKLGDKVRFKLSSSEGVILGKIAESSSDKGVYNATVKGTKAGEITITPVIAGVEWTTQTKPLTLVAGLVDKTKSIFEAKPNEIVADGKDKSVLTFTAKDQYGNAVRDIAKALRFDIVGSKETTRADDGAQLTEIKESDEAKGTYTATLVGKTSGTYTITPKYHGLPAGPDVTVTMKQLDVDEAHSSFNIEPNEIIANGVAKAVLSFTAKDINGNPVEKLGDKLRFKLSASEGVTLDGTIKENKGVYSTTVTGTKAGEIIVTPVLSGVEWTKQAKPLTLVAAKASLSLSFAEGEHSMIYGDKFELPPLSTGNEDIHLEDLTLQWSSSNSDVATIDQTGKLSVNKSGDVIVSVEHKGSDTISDSKTTYSLTVLKRKVDISFANPSLKISALKAMAGEQSYKQKTKEALPDDIQVVWASSNSDVLALNDDSSLKSATMGSTNIQLTVIEDDRYLKNDASYNVDVIGKASVDILKLNAISGGTLESGNNLVWKPYYVDDNLDAYWKGSSDKFNKVAKIKMKVWSAKDPEIILLEKELDLGSGYTGFETINPKADFVGKPLKISLIGYNELDEETDEVVETINTDYIGLDQVLGSAYAKLKHDVYYNSDKSKYDANTCRTAYTDYQKDVYMAWDTEIKTKRDVDSIFTHNIQQNLWVKTRFNDTSIGEQTLPLSSDNGRTRLEFASVNHDPIDKARIVEDCWANHIGGINDQGSTQMQFIISYGKRTEKLHSGVMQWSGDSASSNQTTIDLSVER